MAATPSTTVAVVLQLVAFLYLVAVGTFLQHMDGLGTGLLLLLIAVAWLVYQRGGAETLADAMALGFVLGLVVLARTNGVILVLALVVGEFARRDFDRIDVLRRVAIVGTMVGFLTSPWWFYNLLGFGTLVPSSASPTHELLAPGARVGRAVSGWLADAVPWIQARKGDGALANALRLVLIVSMFLGLPGRRRHPLWSHTTVRVDRTRRFGLYVVAFTLALAAWACVAPGASPADARLFAPLIPCAALAFAFAAWRFTRHTPSIAAAAAIGLVVTLGWAVAALHRGRAG